MSRTKAVLAYTLYSIHAVATLAVSLRNRHSSEGQRSMVVAGGAVALLGLLLYMASIGRFSSLGQLSGLERGDLVTGGVYHYTRNPQIVGWGIALLGAALGGRSGKALGLVAAYFLVHRLYFPFEERSLERFFGAEYRSYLARTPRFLGIPG